MGGSEKFRKTEVIQKETGIFLSFFLIARCILESASVTREGRDVWDERRFDGLGAERRFEGPQVETNEGVLCRDGLFSPRAECARTSFEREYTLVQPERETSPMNGGSSDRWIQSRTVSRFVDERLKLLRR